MVNFLKDPTGEVPWDEEPDAKDVVHLYSSKVIIHNDVSFFLPSYKILDLLPHEEKHSNWLKTLTHFRYRPFLAYFI